MTASKEAIVICLDVGPHMLIKLENDDSTPSEVALECLHWIIQRRIFSESKDEIGLVVFGSKESKNPLSQGDQYKNITVLRALSQVDWDLVKIIANDVPMHHTVEADFVDALIVALDLMHSGSEGKKFARRSIVLISNLCAPFSDDQLENVLDAMKNDNVEFAAIGPTFAEEEADDLVRRNLLSQQQVKGEQIIQKMVDSLDGTCLSLNQALPLLSYFSRRQINPTAWKCNLEIGADIRIPICMYLKTKENKIKQSWKFMSAQDSSAEISALRTYQKRVQSDEEDESGTNKKLSVQNGSKDGDSHRPIAGEIEMEDTVKAYKYGTSLVPLDQIDLETVRYKNDGKSFKLLAFTHKRNVKRHYFMGEGAHVVLPDAVDQFGCLAFSALFKAMLELKVCALIRYAYNVRANPRIGALIPDLGADGSECFVYVPLPFSEDCRFFPFASLNNENNKPTETQTKAMDSFIDSMNLGRSIDNGTAVDSQEGFDPLDVINPNTQYVFQCLQHRLLCPDESLPEPSQRLMSTISPQESRLNIADAFIKSIQESFKLERVIRAEKRTAAAIFTKPDELNEKMLKLDQDVEESSAARYVKISTVKPVEDFNLALENNAENFELACSKLCDVVQQFVFDCAGSQLHAKALECLKVFREYSIKLSQPGYYNRFISTFKTQLLSDETIDFWNKVCSSELGLICDEESTISEVSRKEADEFMKNEENKIESKEVMPESEQTDENLLDELE